MGQQQNQQTTNQPPNFTVEFHHELPEGIPDSIVQQSYEGLNRVVRGKDDISHALINIKMPAQNRETQYVYEITIRLWRDGHDVVATEHGQTLDGTLGAAFDVIERQLRKVRDR